MSYEQRLLYDALSARGQSHAHMYLGALVVLADANNPDRMALAAHGLREAAGVLLRDLGASLRERGEGLGGRVKRLGEVLDRARASSDVFDPGRGSDRIDASVRRVLRELEEVVEWDREHNPTRREKARRALRRLSVQGQEETEAMMEEWVGALIACISKLDGIAHHNIVPSDEEFVTLHLQVESLLLVAVRGPAEDLAELDELLGTDHEPN